MNKDETLVKITEAAKMLNVHPNTLRKWDNKGILVAIRFGERKDRRYKVSDIEEYIARNKK
ncbi:DNA-binding protein [candidate division WWE3 bacterium CG_4_10_14_0_2_um_filter_41_14]|uniref:DNA-binding protein n=1 Tax=candidate division WWE3 bacterium CG_4_10_14_0_2_um_filter_41_14 TaxID=1975072 RepID=A0A2M7TER3_UNCKA|nr:MAG: DNA-binding protein [candidate division WWE3 bacterium CG_4_10_14_0_2_um_filter_41_14]